MKGSSHSAMHRRMVQWAVTVALGLTLGVAPRAAQAVCAGDCNGGNTVTLDETLKVANIVLGNAEPSSCNNADSTGGGVNVDDVVAAAAQAGCQVVAAVCGNGVTEGPDEECDNGGICTGGTNPGTSCSSEAECQGSGVCIQGDNAQHACNTNEECPGSTCQRCTPRGGDGCARNCTFETDIPVALVPGEKQGSAILPGTSGAIVNSEIATLPLPLTGTQTLTVGKRRNGEIPLVIKTASVYFPRIPVGSLACACVRAVSAKTCGGALYKIDGELATNCTPGFNFCDPNLGTCSNADAITCDENSDCQGQAICDATGENPCGPVHGEGNAATGVISCDGGLDGVDLLFSQDSGGGVDDPGPPVIDLSGTGGPGSGVILNTTAIGTVTDDCNDPAVIPDFCTEADPVEDRGIVATLPNVTGFARGIVYRANGSPDFNMAQPCGHDPCPDPFEVQGSLFSCAAIESGSAAGSSVAGAFTALNNDPLLDIAVTNVLVFKNP